MARNMLLGRRRLWSRWIVVVTVLGSFALATAVCVRAASDPGLASSGLRYELSLAPLEFSLLVDAAQRSLSAQGGRTEFTAKLERIATDVEWTITVKDSALIDSWRVSLASKAADMVSAADFGKLSDTAKKEFAALKSLMTKLDEAKAHPVWDTVTFAGTLSAADGNVYIRNASYSYKVTGSLLDNLRSRIGKPTVVTGYLKAGDEIEVTRFAERRTNTLDLLVMSQCPFAKRAESAIISFLRTATPDGQTPQLDVHYILYKRQVDGKDKFTSMHGEDELNEDLVQIVIRDRFPKSFPEYLGQRAAGDAPWKQIASDAGMDAAAVNAIETEIKANREALLKREYDYVAELYLVYDGSPTYIWEGVRIPDIRQVKPFAGLDVTKEACKGL